MKISHILCPTDFSEASRHAVDQAVVIARYYGADVTALHVLSPLVPSADGAVLDRLREEGEAFFEPVAAAGIVVHIEIEVGLPVEQIISRASSLPADLIIMGTHGASGVEHLVLGSVTEKVLRKAECAVLTVPPRAHATSKLPFEHLLCAVDFSEASLDAVQAASSLAGESAATLTLLHVIEWPWEEPPPPAFQELPKEQGAALAAFRRYSEESAKKRLESLAPKTPSGAKTCVRNGKAHVQILEEAAKEHSDLIIIGVRGRNPADLTLFGSTTNQVVRRATCPVLTLR